jgi:hypothetical protein
MVWPGYEVLSKSLSHGIFLNVDTITKFVNCETMFDYIDYLKQEKRYTKGEIVDLFTPDPEGKKKRFVVMTTYNSKTYQLDGIDFD